MGKGNRDKKSNQNDPNGSSARSSQSTAGSTASQIQVALNSLAPHPAAVKAAQEANETDEEHCHICTDPITWYSIGECNHAICHLCSLRLRALMKDQNCPLCKSAIKSVVYTGDSKKSFIDFNLVKMPLVDKKLAIYFDNNQVFEDVMILLRFNCPDPECDVACPEGWSELKRHAQKAHGKFLCDLCTRHKKLFTHEHSLYTSAELERHYRLGDQNDNSFKGHPNCGFCRISYYGDDELYEHCRKDHEQCFLCTRAGIRHQYYENYRTLESHFHSDHFSCMEPDCVEKKFQVFATDIDLKAHDMECHPHKRTSKSKGEKIDISFQFVGGPTKDRRRNESRSQRDGSASGSSRADTSVQEQEELNSERRIRPPPGFGAQLSESPRVERTPAAAQPLPTSTMQQQTPRWVGISSNLQMTTDNFPPPAASVLSSSKSSQNGRPNSNSGDMISGSASFSSDGELGSRLQALFSSDASKFAEFKSLASSFRSSGITADEFLTAFMALALDGRKAAMDLRDAEVASVRAWTRLAETVPEDREELAKMSQKARKKASAGRKSEEMMRALQDYKAKKIQAEDTIRPVTGTSYASSANRPGLTNVSVSTVPGGPGVSAARVLVIKSTSKSQRIHAGNWNKVPGVESGRNAPEDQSNEFRPSPVNAAASNVEGTLGTRSTRPLSVPFSSAGSSNGSPSALSKNKAEFPSLPMRANAVPKYKQDSKGNGSWNGSQPDDDDFHDEGTSKSEGGGGKKKGKGKTTVLLHFG